MDSMALLPLQPRREIDLNYTEFIEIRVRFWCWQIEIENEIGEERENGPERED